MPPGAPCGAGHAGSARDRRAAAQNGYRFSSFVVAAAKSAPFLSKTKSLDQQQPEQ
jgi:hypothetical protein